MPTAALHRRRRQGFTLIELMLAMALGMVIVFTAFAGVRVAGQCYTISTRLSLENAMLRTGFMKALDELDFWNSYDDPFDNTAGSMQWSPYNGGEVMRNAGLPFCPLVSAANFPGKSSDLVASAQDAYNLPYIPYIQESSITGWHPEYSWPMADPATWCRLNMGESVSHNNQQLSSGNQPTHPNSEDDLRFGYYGQFSGTYTTFPSGNASAYNNYTAPQVTHTWLSLQMENLKNALGYYGMIEYLPANTIYAYNSYNGAKNGSSACNYDAMSYEMSFATGNGGSGAGPVGYFADGDGGTQFPRGLYRDNKDVAFAIYPTNPQIMFAPWSQPGTFNSTANVANMMHQYYNTGQYATPQQMQFFQNLSTTNSPLMATQPITWPGVSTSVERFITYDRFAAVMRVKMTNSTTGQHLEFNFSGFGTSLRGARQQRALNLNPGSPYAAGSGWAQYDNDQGPNTPAKTKGRNDDNLDTQ